MMLLAGCATVQERAESPWARHELPPAVASPNIVQGTVGITTFDYADAGIALPGVDIRDSGLRTLPMLGGSVQHVLRNDRIQIGVESGFTFGWDSDKTVIAVGGGTIVTERDNDIFLLDAFVGAYVNIPMESGWRIYGGAGPVLQYASIELEFIDTTSEVAVLKEDGFGGGWYARAGCEIEFGMGTMVGFGVRWLDSYADLGGAFRDLTFRGMQTGLTVSQSF